MPLVITQPTVGGDNGSWGTKLNDALDAVVAAVNTNITDIAARLALVGGVMTGRIDLHSTTLKRVDKGSISGAQALDLSVALSYTATIGGATVFSFTNVPAGTFMTGVILRLVNPGSAAITWPAGTKWPGGSAPALTVAGTDLVVLLSDDNGTTWRANAIRDLR